MESGQQFVLKYGAYFHFVLLERVDSLCIYKMCGVFEETPCGLGGTAVCNECHDEVVSGS